MRAGALRAGRGGGSSYDATIMITKIKFIGIPVRDQNRALAFYTDKIEVYEVEDAAVNRHSRAKDSDEDFAITVDDVVQHTDSGSGAPQRERWPANVTAPAPVRNRDFMRELARVLHRPAFMPAPAFALKIALGEMAGPLLLASERVVPAHAVADGFTFLYPELGEALRHVFGTVTI